MRPLLAAAAFLLTGAVSAATFGNYIYTLPAGWSASKQGSTLVITPDKPGPGERVSLRLTPGGPPGGPLDAWFGAQVKAFNAGAQETRASPVQKNTDEAGRPVLSEAVLVSVNGQPEWRFFVATQAGPRAEMLVYTASSLETYNRYLPVLTRFADAADFANLKSPSPTAKTPAATTPAQTPPSQTAPANSPASASLPALPRPDVAKLVQAGLDPQKQPFPDEFRCYLSANSADYSHPTFALQILPGGQYRAPGGGGSYATVQDGSLSYLRWKSGPLAGSDDAFLLFNRTYGQSIRLDGVTDKDYRLECYQRGGREAHELAQFRRNDPQVGRYACRATDGSAADRGVLEVLAGRRYRYGGGAGTYRVNLLGNQGDTFGSVEFSGGPLDDTNVTYAEDELGERRFSVINRIECRVLAKPVPEPMFGPAKAPAPPAGSGGLSGAYTFTVQQFYPDARTVRYFYVFNPNGYVYTDDPETSLNDADCSRTRPSGLPLCELYTVKNGQITIGRDKPASLSRSGNILKLGGDTLTPITPPGALKLNGTYKATNTFSAPGGTGGGIFTDALTFRPDGRFTRARDGGVAITTTTTGTSTGDVTGGVSSSSSKTSGGTYSFSGNTLTLKYGDGRAEKLFAFLPGPAKGGKPDLTWLYAGGSEYFLKGAK